MCFDFGWYATRRLSRQGDQAKFLAITFHTIRVRGILFPHIHSQQGTSTALSSPVRNREDAFRGGTHLGSDSEQEEDDVRGLQGQSKILKKCLTAWRFRRMDCIALTYDEFERGMKMLDYFPPIIISKDDWNERVVRYTL